MRGRHTEIFRTSNLQSLRTTNSLDSMKPSYPKRGVSYVTRVGNLRNKKGREADSDGMEQLSKNGLVKLIRGRICSNNPIL